MSKTCAEIRDKSHKGGRDEPPRPLVRVARRQLAGVWDLQVVLITAATNVAR